MVRFNNDAVWWEGPLAVDADGAPNAYAPNNQGLDWTADAGHDGDWYGVVCGPDGKPVVQGPGDPYPGDYIPTTALTNPALKLTDPRRYVDSSVVPYLSIPSDSIGLYGIHVGDVGFAFCRRTGQMCAAIVADVGPRGKYGEGSMALARALGLSSSPRNGGASSGVVCCVFKGSRRGWPRTNADVSQQVQDIINALGGASAYQAIVAPQS